MHYEDPVLGCVGLVGMPTRGAMMNQTRHNRNHFRSRGSAMVVKSNGSICRRVRANPSMHLVSARDKRIGSGQAV